MNSSSRTTPPADFERIVPRHDPGRAAPPPPSTRPSTTHREVPAARFIAGLIALLMLGALVIGLLPRWRSPDTAPTAPVTEAASPARAKPAGAAAPATATPATWDDPALLEARAAAQQAREQFQQQASALQQHGIARWGASALAAAQARATVGETAFEAKDFLTARREYEGAAAATAALAAESPQRLTAALASATQALDQGNKSAAQAGFDLALALDPGNATATRGLARVTNLDAVRSKLEAARRLEQAGDIIGARAALQAALQLDADSRTARDTLARLDAQQADEGFRRALAEGLAAVERGELDTAQARLASARALHPDDAGVQQLATQLVDAHRLQKIAALQREATRLTQGEDWAGATQAYRAALALDASLAFAREGLAICEPRAALAASLDAMLARPQRLTSEAVAAEAQGLLARARAIAAAGPKLRAQITQLDGALAQAAQPIPVQLRSDGQTEVTIYRVGSLGRFSAQTLALKPGHYVALGSRIGYRDVRREFEVQAGTAAPSIEVRCEETL